MDWFLSWCVLGGTLAWLLARWARPARGPLVAVAALVCVILALSQVALAYAKRGAARAKRGLEALLPRSGLAGYASSDACRACHPSEYASWHRSYHRTMTAVATPDSVRGPFDGRALVQEGRAYRLQSHDGAFWVDAGAGERRITMVTGSHHMQAYWYAGGDGNGSIELPFTYLLDERRWVPRRDAFLISPEYPKNASIWNTSCIECHATAGQPRVDVGGDHPATRVEELGIACEACHGPGEAHVEANANPIRRALVRRAGGRDATIVNPLRLSAAASAQVCGQCHGIACKLEGWHERGADYRPGEDLARAKPMVDPRRIDASPCKGFIEREEAFVESRFWSDGQVRVSGREHNALVGSACFRSGKLACTSCHSMHASEPDDQLARGMDGDAACATCHAEQAAAPSAHTHHGEGSPGSACYACHMPQTTYGLLKAIRSHTITSPRVAATLETGRPNACNLCHLDKSLGWTADALARWYGTKAPELDGDARAISAAVRDALAGDAGQRALVAWAMGRKEAQRASGSDWLAPYLAELLVDRYPAVRELAYRSLRTLGGFENIAYDYVGTASQRATVAAEVANRWRARGGRGGSDGVLIGPDGALREPEWNRLAAERDDHDMFLAE